MQSPITGKQMTLKPTEKTLSFRGEEFVMIYQSYFCEESGSHFTTTELDELNIKQVHNKYREKHNIPLPEDITRIRNKYDLSQRKMSLVLGLGVNSFNKYENGEVPSISNSNLILLADDPKAFKQIVKASAEITPQEKKRLIKKINKIILEEEEKGIDSEFEYYLFNGKISEEYSGYKRPSLSKLIEMVTYFTHELQPWKTQLNKLLFYADFTLYRETGYSMSGTPYRAITLGPVPYKYQSLFEYMVDNSFVNVNYQEFSNGEGEQFIPSQSKSFNPEVFDEIELKVLSKVLRRFKDVNTKEIISISHMEDGWKENKDYNKLISYKYAFYLKAL